jgi:hypothetical protein
VLRRAPMLLPGLAGFAVPAIAAALILAQADNGSPARATPPPAVSTRVSAPDTESINRMRTIAQGQLRDATGELRDCRKHRGPRSSMPTTRWRDCVRWPFARLGAAGATNGRIMWTLADDLPDGRCRAMVAGGANAMRFVGQSANEISRALLGSGRRTLMQRGHDEGLRLIEYLREQLRARAWRTCARTSRPAG